MGTKCVVQGAIVVVALALCAGARADVYGKYKGQIIVSDQAIPVGDNDQALTGAIQKMGKTTVERAKGSAGWDFFVMAFLSKKPGEGALSLLYYDVSNGKRTYLTGKDIIVDAGATIVTLETDVNEEDGVKSGAKIELVLGRVVGDREVVLAKARLTFK